VLYMDGTRIGSVVTPAASTFAYAELGTGLDASSHLWEIVFTAEGGGYLYQVYLGPGALLETKPAPRPVAIWYGDSIAAGAGLPSTDKRQIDYFPYPTGYTGYGLGFVGTAVTTYLRDNAYRLGVGPVPPSLVVSAGGVNDQGNALDGNPPPSSFGTDYVTMLGNIAGYMQAGGTILVRAILPNTGTNYANRGLFNAAISAAVTTYNASKVNGVTAQYMETDGWIIGTCCADTVDGLHPNAAGFAKIRAREEQFFRHGLYPMPSPMRR
jgi:lysophospholipase L1-like esterase